MRDGGMNPRLLLVEDDPVSQAFLSAAASALPAEVDCAGSLHEALALAAAHRHDAWLIDAQLPDGRGSELLSQLRAATPQPHPFALGHTAERSNEALAALRAAGFDAALSKPLPVAAWQAAIRQGLDARPNAGTTPAWNDAQALRALNGNRQSMAALRALFRDELPKQHRVITSALDAGDAASALAELHRLKASCGFVGATRLQQASAALHAAAGQPDARAAFDAAVALTLASEAGDA